MLSSTKQGIKQALHAMGIEAHCYDHATSPSEGLLAALRATCDEMDCFSGNER